MIDDAHATGFLGQTGRGTHEYRGVMGKTRHHHRHARAKRSAARAAASPAAANGSSSCSANDRVPIFSRTAVAPPIVAASIKAIELLTSSTELRDKLEENTKFFRAALTERGLTIKPGTPSDRADHAGRRRAIAKVCGSHAGEGRLRDRLFLSGRAARHGACSDASLGRAFARRPRVRGQRVRGNE